MNLVLSKQLAWELVDQLGGRLSEKDRMDVFVDLGSGEEVGAIGRLLHIAAKHGYPLPARMVQKLHVWASVHGVEECYTPVFARIESARARTADIAAMRARLRIRR